MKLELTPKEVVIFHIMYTIACNLLLYEEEELMARVENLDALLTKHYTKEEEKILGNKITKLAEDIPIETLKELDISRENV